ncbi:peptidoglycan-binding protein LysM [Ligilactobacillus salitolerans]|uniref:Peptidoglycan-binding protein LysM n=1 Tax=Ligilactobacillus salitolerans TaxID=1808352 RepID=A0A401IRN3_9LACO|nr:LysM peptidoglycan-binding domain-containing protein [Ligilactobacillus salitolerans]GBG94200.1 peptidoglycan-binding protein LysM [Ligilactobacillus salitolerans]
MDMKKTMLSVTAAAGLLTAGSIAANADTVTVKPGDTVSGIAAAHNTTVAAIEKANKLADVNFILPGQKLDIDAEGNVTVEAQPQATQSVQAQAPVQQAPVQTQAPVQQKAASTYHATKAYTQKAQTTTQSSVSLSGSETAARQFIMARESGGNYNANNRGKYIGAYQLSADKLNGDYSRANQDRVANQYVQSRYGSWVNAQKYWNQHHSY